MIKTWLRDQRYALRMLARAPGFTAVAMVAIALGIGANTAIFSVVESILLRPLAYADPGRIVVAPHEGALPVSPADYLDYRREARSFQELAAAQFWSGNIAGRERSETVPGIQVTANLFPLLGVPPLLGRTFEPFDEQPGAAQVLVLSYKLWQRSFGGDAGVVGRAVTLDGRPYTVVGVMPRSFQFAPFWATQAEMWTPLAMANRINDRDGRSLRVFGRLRPGVTLAGAQAEMTGLANRLAVAYPQTNAKLGIRVLPLRRR